MRHFAITGIETDSWISVILSGSAMRATPPSARMSAGTRSSAITAQAPASSAMRACSASVTSMITPPFSISARPLLTLIVPVSAIALILAVGPGGLVNGSLSSYGRSAAQPLREEGFSMNASAGTVEAPADRSLRTRLRPGRRRAPSVSFPELVWLHQLRQDELKRHRQDPYEGPAELRYRSAVERFEQEHGPIVEAYWCTEEASAVAVTLRRRPLILPDVVRLHWATDWSTKDQPALMALLYRCEALAVRVHEVLRDTSQRLATQSLYTVMSYLLAFCETERCKDKHAVAEIERTTRQELKSINSYYHRAAVRS